ncbi:MAG: helix-turn-helix transcriptional regulator [Phycisphaerales bacterium]|nr:helix-turn-helix transcriptional regulator [Phycisphaerales bacterium]
MIDDFAAWVRQTRLARGLSQGDLAEESGLSRELINRLERQRVEYVSELTIIRLVRALGRKPPASVLAGLPVAAAERDIPSGASIDWDQVLEDAPGSSPPASLSIEAPDTGAAVSDLSSLRAPCGRAFPQFTVTAAISRALGLSGKDVQTFVLGESAGFRPAHPNFKPGDFIVASPSVRMTPGMLSCVEIAHDDDAYWVAGFVWSRDGEALEIHPVLGGFPFRVPFVDRRHILRVVAHLSTRLIPVIEGEPELRVIMPALRPKESKRPRKKRKKES